MSKAINILIVVVLISAIAMLLYPTISDQYSQYVNNRRILSYNREIEVVDPVDNAEMMAAAHAYNDAIRNTEIRDAFNEAAAETSAEYRALLNPNGDGVMGVIEIPKIGIRLPIYHGTDDAGSPGARVTWRAPAFRWAVKTPTAASRATGGCPARSCLRTWTGWSGAM